MPLPVLEVLELLAVQPVGVGIVRFQLDLQHARFPVGLILRFSERFRRGALPGGGPTPGVIGHFLAEGDLDFDGTRATSLAPDSGTVFTTTGGMDSISPPSSVESLNATRKTLVFGSRSRRR